LQNYLKTADFWKKEVSLIKRYSQTVKATELRLVLNWRFFQVVFTPIIVLYFKFKKSIKLKQEPKCDFFSNLIGKKQIS